MREKNDKHARPPIVKRLVQITNVNMEIFRCFVCLFAHWWEHNCEWHVKRLTHVRTHINIAYYTCRMKAFLFVHFKVALGVLTDKQGVEIYFFKWDERAYGRTQNVLKATKKRYNHITIRWFKWTSVRNVHEHRARENSWERQRASNRDKRNSVNWKPI